MSDSSSANYSYSTSKSIDSLNGFDTISIKDDTGPSASDSPYNKMDTTFMANIPRITYIQFQWATQLKGHEDMTALFERGNAKDEFERRIILGRYVWSI